MAAFSALILLASFSFACTAGDGSINDGNGDSDSSGDYDMDFSGTQCGDDTECSASEVCYGNYCIPWEENPCFENGQCVSDNDCRQGQLCNDECTCVINENSSCKRDEDCGAGMICYEGVCYTDSENPCDGAGGDCVSDLDCANYNLCDDTCNCSSENPDGDQDGEDNRGPKVSVPAELKFGAVILDHEVESSFTITSAGDENLQVLSIELENSEDPEFTLVDPPSSKFALAPGDTYNQAVKYRPIDPGVDNRNVLIATNDPNLPIARIALVSEYKGDANVQVQPEEIDFGLVEVQSGQETVEVTITNIPGNVDDNMLLEVWNIHLGSEETVDFSIDYDVINERFYLAPNQSRTFNVNFHPRNEGEFSEVLIIPNSDTQIQIPLNGKGATPLLYVYPLDEDGKINFGQIRIGHSVNKPLTLKNMGQMLLFINSVYLDEEGDEQFLLDDNDINAQGVALQPNEEITVTIYYEPTEQEANVSILRIVSNAYDGNVRSFPIEGQGIISKITTEPTEAEFGDVLINTTETMEITLTNSGDAELTLLDFLLPQNEEDFSVQQDAVDLIGVILQPGDSETFTIEYTPLSVETDASTLTIVSDDEESPEYSLPLSGRGVGPKLRIRRLDDPSFTDTVYFGEVSLNDIREVELRLENIGQWDLDITSLELTENSYYDEFAIDNPDATYTIVPGGHEVITLTYAPVTFPGPDSGEFIVHSSDYENPDTLVYMDGMGSNPRITVTPNSWTFADTLPLGDRTQSFFISNTGLLGELEISRILIGVGTDYAFSISYISQALPFVLGENESMEFQVTFHPSDLGLYESTIVIESDDTQTTLKTVPVSGECVPCPDGWWDIDTNHNQCEYHCIKTVDPAEICDGADNDCNGLTDEGADVTDNCENAQYSDVSCVDGECVYECIDGFHSCPDEGCVYSGASDHCGSANCEPCPQPENALAVCIAGGLDYECDFICAGGYIKTDDGCVAPGDPDHCGPDEEVCQAPSNGVALCVNEQCDYACNIGYHDCPDDPQGPCVASNHPDHCGSMCGACPIPTNATPLCLATTGGYMCDFLCNTWYHKEGNECVLNNTPDCCGQSCLSCGPDPINGEISCEYFSCDISCDSGFHACGNVCSNNLDPLTCGARCTACPEPSNSDATCDGTYCGFVCHTGFHKEGNECVWNNLNNCCGPSCSVCSAPEHATPYCNGYSCEFTCNAGYHPVGNLCVINGDVNNCGPTGIVCPGNPPNGQYFCDVDHCELACDAGYHDCESACLSDTSVDHCGESCDECLYPPHSNPTCNGFDCDFECHVGYHLDGEYCVPNANTDCCGPACLQCSAQDNAIAVCNNGVCDFVCEEGYHECGDYCVDDLSIDHCGTSCLACQHPSNASASCNGVACSWECDANYHEDEEQCLPNNTSDCCGSACNICPTLQHGTPACIGGVCSFFCDNGYHACGSDCVSNLSVDHCGLSCSTCPNISNAEETCNGVSCDFECYQGYHEENGVCVQNTTIDCCGQNCMYCPDIYTNGSPICQQLGPEYFVCDFVCDSEYHKCGDYCLSDDSVSSCGSNCIPCSAPANSSAFCDSSEKCDFTCNNGYYELNSACLTCNTVNKCGPECIQCPSAPLGGTAICTGTFGDPCDFTCNPGYHRCTDDLGQEVCVLNSSIYTCGSSCEPCNEPSNGYATCTGGTCGIVCNEGYHQVGSNCVANNTLNCCGDGCVVCPDYSNADETCTSGSCTYTCHQGYYKTANGCVACDVVDHCGLNCSQCSSPDNSSPYCSTSSGNPICDFSCFGGYHECPGNSVCFADSDPLHCGTGSGCLQCTVPSGNGTPLCLNNQCSIQCNTGYHEEYGDCVLNNNPDCCGVDCDGCWKPTYGQSFCDSSGSEPFCDFYCAVGYHRCHTGAPASPTGDDCVVNSSVNTCGSSCTPCSGPESGTSTGTATCISDGYDWVCSFTCLPGYHRVGNSCVLNQDPWCCGAGCLTCTAPENGTALCSNGLCDFTCYEGYHRCGSQCVTNYSENTCGSSCAPCTKPLNGFATCDGVSCGVECYPGYHENNGACVANSTGDCCGQNCETCTGPDNSTSSCVNSSYCSWSCNSGYHKCGDECLDNESVDSCGSLCSSCPEPDNTVAYCEDGSCAWDCLENYFNSDGNASNGCESYCVASGGTDYPDDQFIDNNCDGLDGEWNNAVFVATDGNDSDAGTAAKPKRTIQAALNAAYYAAPKKYVIVSQGTYYESISLRDGVSVYGSYSRAHNWLRQSGFKSIISGGTTAVSANNIAEFTIIDRLYVYSADASAGNNSHALYISNSSNALLLKNLIISAGKGGTGQDGQGAITVGTAGAIGGNASNRTGGVGGFSACAMGNSGGSGGSGGTNGSNGTGPSAGTGGSMGAWNPFDCCNGCDSGTAGGAGGTGAVGVSGNDGTTTGSVISGYWKGQNGTDGGNGSAGTGGSGGGGGGGCKSWSFLFNFCPSEDGGGGGGGGGAGCGGSGGYGGKPGGASFGIFLNNASPEVVECDISTEGGGDGGSGGAGSSGGLGGDGGTFAEGTGEAKHGGRGGRGGDGGRGGNGGGGSGGVSYCIYRAGTSNPELDTTNTYSPGLGGVGGNFSAEAESGDVY